MTQATTQSPWSVRKGVLAAATVALLSTAPLYAQGTTAQTGGYQTISTAVPLSEVDPDIKTLVQITIPGVTLTAVTRKEREGRIYHDVEGLRPNGTVVELDILTTPDGYKVVEIQRDISWAEAPANVREAAAAAQANIKPVRVIESSAADGSVIYELFAQGKPEKPSLEVRVVGGKAQVLTEEWPD